MKSVFDLIRKILILLNNGPMFIREFYEHIDKSKRVKKCLTILTGMKFIEIDITYIRLTKHGEKFINDLNKFDDSEINKAIETLSVYYLTEKLDKLFKQILEI